MTNFRSGKLLIAYFFFKVNTSQINSIYNNTCLVIMLKTKCKSMLIQDKQTP